MRSTCLLCDVKSSSRSTMPAIDIIKPQLVRGAGNTASGGRCCMGNVAWEMLHGKCCMDTSQSKYIVVVSSILSSDMLACHLSSPAECANHLLQRELIPLLTMSDCLVLHRAPSMAGVISQPWQRSDNVSCPLPCFPSCYCFSSRHRIIDRRQLEPCHAFSCFVRLGRSIASSSWGRGSAS